MSKAKYAAAAAPQQTASSSGSFASGFLLGQLTLSLILFFFIKFFLFGDAPSADSRAAIRATARRQRTLSHSASLRKKRSSAALGARHVPAVGSISATPTLTADKILDKTYYNVDGHQPESLDWFNVLIAQTIAQLRADALDDDGLLSSLTRVLNGPSKPDFLDDIRVTEISLGEEFPIFSNCRVIPVDPEDGSVVKPGGSGRPGNRRGANNALRDSRLQARMDVDLSDVVTLGIETKLLLNYPKPFVAALPVALSVSVVRFSGTLSLSFTPSQAPPPPPPATAPLPTRNGHSTTHNSSASPPTSAPEQEGHDPQASPPPLAPQPHLPTTLTFTFLDDYRLDLSVHSLIGSRSRLQDVPKIAQLVEQRLHAWFDERCVEPRFQQIALPSLWPRKRNARGGGGEDAGAEDESVIVTDGGGEGHNPAGTTHGSSALGLGEAIDEADLLGPSRVATAHTPQTRSAALSTGSNTAAAAPSDGTARRRPPPLQRNTSSAAGSRTYAVAADEDALAQAGAALREAEHRARLRAKR